MLVDPIYADSFREKSAAKFRELRKANPEKYKDKRVRRRQDQGEYKRLRRLDPEHRKRETEYNASYRKRPDVAEKRRADKKAWLASEEGRIWRRLTERARRKKARAGSNKATRAVTRHCQGLLGLQKWRCAVCRTDLKLGKHLDHVIPLAAGGRHEVGNFQWLCPDCNLAKSAKHPVEFMQSRGFLL